MGRRGRFRARPAAAVLGALEPALGRPRDRLCTGATPHPPPLRPPDVRTQAVSECPSAVPLDLRTIAFRTGVPNMTSLHGLRSVAVSPYCNCCPGIACISLTPSGKASWTGVFLQSVVGPHLERVLGKRSMKARQASARGGELQVDVDRGACCVRAAGQAVIVLSGLLHL